jgi:preprotein translocase subunit SecB
MTELEQRHRSGLKFDWVVVRELRFEDNLSEHVRSQASNLRANVEIKTWVADDANHCRTYLRLSLAPPEDGHALFKVLSAAVEGQFTVEGEAPTSVSIEEFVRKQAPAILFPFLRQLVASVTSTSRFGQVLVPPINVVALMGDVAKQRE